MRRLIIFQTKHGAALLDRTRVTHAHIETEHAESHGLVVDFVERQSPRRYEFASLEDARAVLSDIANWEA